MDLFDISRSKGIFHTVSLWAMLSPRLANNEKAIPGAVVKSAVTLADPQNKPDADPPSITD